MMNSRINPLILHKDGSTECVTPLGKRHEVFGEQYLQNLLVDHPELLPVSVLRPDVGELLCIGREVATHAGNIDNLYLSTGGYPVVVETKLWRNPQARREVVSQVLDYVKDIVARDYTWFEDQWKQSSKEEGDAPSTLIEALSRISGDDIDEREYVDRVHQAIDRGDVIALIVGDGIETRLQELVAHLCRDSAHLRYSLGLVALQCYEMDENHRLLVVPQLINEVEPVERAHVRIDVADDLKSTVKVSSVIETPPSTSAGPRRRTLSEDDLLESLAQHIGTKGVEKVRDFISHMSDHGVEMDWKSSTVMLKIADPAGETIGASLLAITRDGHIYNSAHGQSTMIKRWGWDHAVAQKIIGGYFRKLHELDHRFSTEGIVQTQSGLFLPLAEVIDKLDAIAAATTEAAAAVQEASAA